MFCDRKWTVWREWVKFSSFKKFSRHMRDFVMVWRKAYFWAVFFQLAQNSEQISTWWAALRPFVKALDARRSDSFRNCPDLYFLCPTLFIINRLVLVLSSFYFLPIISNFLIFHAFRHVKFWSNFFQKTWNDLKCPQMTLTDVIIPFFLNRRQNRSSHVKLKKST